MSDQREIDQLRTSFQNQLAAKDARIAELEAKLHPLPSQYKEISPQEFADEGYLMELNRLVLHPMGLAMYIHYDDEGNAVSFGGVFDWRDDDEGGNFKAPDEETRTEYERKMLNFSRLVNERRPVRVEKMGYWVQPGESALEAPENP